MAYMRKKIALFGGTFDPIHSSHVTMALRLVEELELDQVILMPTFVPPHKIKTTMAAVSDRLEMCRLACEAYPQLTVSDLEVRRQGASFTADTLKALQQEVSDAQWYLITGADMFCTLRTWYHFDQIAQTAVLCTVPRQGVTAEELEQYADVLRAAGANCYVSPEPVPPISSTEIRRRAAAGMSLHGLVPPEVEKYIQKQGLFQKPEAMEMHRQEEQFKAILRTRLGEYRYHHSLCVAQEAARLAQRYGADSEKAYTAGLLHDIMKDTEPNAQLQILADFAILLDDVEQVVPSLWHARAGAAFIRGILQVQDEEIVSAVRYHTTGRKNMTLLEKVLFVADFTSADREYPDVEQMRCLADQSLESAMVYGLDFTIRYLLERGQPIHPDTVDAYNDRMLEKLTRPTNEGGLTHEE